MKSSSSGIIKLLISIAIILVFHFFYFKVFTLLGVYFDGDAYNVANFIKYLLLAFIILIIYLSNIRAGRRSFNKGLLSSILYSIICFVILVAITVAVTKALNYFHLDSNYTLKYYFNDKFNVANILNIIEECIIVPFLLCAIFPLGFSCILKKTIPACITAGIAYGIFYGILLNTSIKEAVIQSITPALIIIVLTYLYKKNRNIWSVYITYVLYIMFGVYLINYIL